MTSRELKKMNNAQLISCFAYNMSKETKKACKEQMMCLQELCNRGVFTEQEARKTFIEFDFGKQIILYKIRKEGDTIYRFPIYWTEIMRIDFLQRVILVHSYLYYMLDDNVWTDKHYDEVARQLTSIQKEHTEEWLKVNTQYGYVFYDYDGTTGFDLWDRLKQKDKQKILSIAESRKMVKKNESRF